MFAALFLVSCFGDSTGPGERRRAGVTFQPVFDRRALTLVDFTRVHIMLVRPGTTPPPFALDTTVDFPSDQDSLRLPLTVVLSPGATSEPFDLSLEMLNAAGAVVFRGGPMRVTATAGVLGGQAPDVPMLYVGTGSNAAGVRFRGPVPSTAFFGDTAVFVAEAYDSAGAAIAGTPILYWVDLADTAKARVPDPAVGRVIAKTVRGPAWVIAQLLTGQTARTSLLVQPRPSAIAVTGGSTQTGRVRAALPQPLAVRVTAADGLGVQGVVVTFAVITGGGSLSATAVTTDSAGYASVVWTLGIALGSQSVTATAGALSTSPISATATVGAAARLVFAVQPTNTNANVVVTPAVQVAAQDSFGNTVTSYTGTVSVAIGTNPGGASLGGTTSVAAVAGVAAFSTLTVTNGGAGYTLVASATGLTSATSSAFNVNGGAPTKLGFVVQPTSAVAGTAIAPAVQVAVQDVNGTTVPSRTDTITLALGTNPGGDTLLGTLQAAAVAGVATFSNLSLRRVATGYTLSAGATGLTGATSAAFNVGAGAAATLSLVSGGNQFAAPSTPLPLPVVVRVTDAYGNGVSGRAVTFAVATGGGSVGTPSTTTGATGSASTTWTLGAAGGAQTITATATGLGGSPLTITASSQIGAPAKLAFLVQPSTAVAGAAITPAVQVVAQDSNGITTASYTGQVGIILSTNPDTALLTGTILVNAVAGVATFSDLSINKADTGYALGAISATLVPAFSSRFAITAGPAKSLAPFSGANQTGAQATQLAQPVVVKVADSLGNGVSGIAVTFAVATGGGSVGTPNATTNASGLASTTWTLGAAAGTQTITATATGLTGSPLTISATAGSVVASDSVRPHFDTLTALGATVRLTAQAYDATHTAMIGHFTWVSRNTSVVTVDTAGLVTAVANGAAYVVATEAGGTQDSALVVVEQRLATIIVTPGARGIYLTGRFRFTASAVDGLGHPVAGVSSFTWTSTAPAVASVDTAGVVTANGLGSTQIRATSGVITGVANVSVLTPITRIAVVVDTVGAATTDTFTFTSLGLSRRYRAIAHDTLDAVMTGVSFTWQSTNGSVAILDSVTATTARATSAANGVTTILATAQGYTSTPGASVTVAQVLAAIALTPASATIAVTGTVGLVARGLDANGRFISGGSFIYRSATPAVATVDSITGRVTGVALGTANITATSGAITSNPAVVLVSATVPAALSFGRDTLSVGRGSSASIPILLSTPAASPLIVKLAVQDTFAYWSTLTVTIPAGQTAINATLNGRNAGTTIITAVDSSGLGYAPTSAVLAVTATMRIASSGFAVNATDIAVTQVLLSDPSPAGGTYVSFGFSTPGIAAVSPDPAFIPAGQLAADIQIRGLAAGSTNITPRAIGVNGTASSFTAYAAIITPNRTSLMLGAGQYDASTYVYAPTYTNTPIPVTLTSSDTTVAVVPPAVTIPANSYYVYFTIASRGTGSATVSVSSPGWTAARSVPVTVTTPRIGFGGGGTLNTTSPATTVAVYAQDSLRTAHYRTSSLVVRLSSRDTTVMKVLDTVVTIAPGQYYNGSPRVIPGGLGGTTYIIATASGHQPDSVLYTVVGPKLQFSWVQSNVGAGQYDANRYVSTPNYVTAPLVVAVSNSNPTSVTTPATDTIPTGSYYRYFNVAGDAPGAATFIASAPGYQPDTASYVVTSPRLTASGIMTYNNFGPGGNVTVYVTDSLRSAHYRTAPLSVSVVSTDTTIIKVDSSTVTIAAGQYYNGQAHVTPVGVGTARIIFTAAGHPTLDTLTMTVQTPKISFSIYSAMYGRRQNSGVNGFYVSTPDYRATPLAATITQKHATVDTLTTLSPTIPASSYYVYLGTYALANGVDTLILAAPSYLPDTAFITVTTPRLTNSGLPGSTTTTNPPIGVTVYATDSVGTGHYISDTLVVAAVSSDTTVLKPTVPYFRILKGAYYASMTVTVVGPGSATVTYSDSAGTGYLPTTTNAITVTGPTLSLSNGAPVLGMRQSGGTSSSYVSTPNYIATPLVVNLVSTGTRVATVPASVTIPAGTYYAYFTVTAQDTLGTIQIQATALGYNGATMNVQVTQPKFMVSTSTQLNTTSPKTSIAVYATDANGTAHYPTENVTVTLVSSDPTVAAIDSSTVTIPAGVYYVSSATWSPGAIGSVQLSAQDVRAAYYKYGTGTANVTVITPTLSFGSYPGALGIGQYQDYVYAQVPNYTTAPLSVTFSHTGTARTGTFTNLTNTPVTGVTIPTGNYYQYFRMSGLVRGTDTLVASVASPAHIPSTIYTVVDSGRVDPIGAWPSTIRAGDSLLVTLYARDPNTSTRYVVAATAFTLAPNANIEFHLAGAVVTTVTIPADAQYVQFYLVGKTAGSGSVTITSANYKTYVNTVTVSP